ncbi:hypothetical protein GGX14DRAFT_406656 [Mycena pura]|uniref:Uncharacterized protein n=1 Tax=Mycena pura TaxID=153505 RepID=A0AAD6URI1_9AGAR|nr:hypothetical protein GGX14DRAFT_406656 [Mycena pura]
MAYVGFIAAIVRKISGDEVGLLMSTSPVLSLQDRFRRAMIHASGSTSVVVVASVGNYFGGAIGAALLQWTGINYISDPVLRQEFEERTIGKFIIETCSRVVEGIVNGTAPCEWLNGTIVPNQGSNSGWNNNGNSQWDKNSGNNNGNNPRYTVGGVDYSKNPDRVTYGGPVRLQTQLDLLVGVLDSHEYSLNAECIVQYMTSNSNQDGKVMERDWIRHGGLD